MLRLDVTFEFGARKPAQGRGRVFTSKRRPASRQHALQTAVTGQLGKVFLEAVEKVPRDERRGEQPELKELLDEMELRAKDHDYYQVAQNGHYKQVYDTMKNIGDGTGLTLGTLSFKQFGPQDQLINVELHQNGGVLQGVHYKNEYALVTAFQVRDGQHKGVKGLFTVSGNYDVDSSKPQRQNIHFDKLRLEPLDTGVDEWIAFAKDNNEMMDNNGVAEISMPQPINGWRDFIYVDETRGFQVTKGNLGSFAALQRIEQT